MLDIGYIKENLDKVRRSIEARKSSVDLDKLLELDTSQKKG
jgi:seryl-tRNA synthetase